MNYWKQFAEMLGLELGEEFVLTDVDGNRDDNYVYKFIEIGLRYKSPSSKKWYGESPYTIQNLLEGISKVAPVTWKPKIYEQYWYCSTKDKPVVVTTTWGGFSGDLCKWKCGNCFKTKKEAEIKGKQIMEQISKEFWGK